MIDWESSSEEFQRKYKFDNVRVMANHMIDDGENVALTVMRDYSWTVNIMDDDPVVLISGKDCDFEVMVSRYNKFNAKKEALIAS